MSTAIITKPIIDVAPEILKDLLSFSQEEGQVIVHCITKTPQTFGMVYRVQKTTFLLDRNSAHQSELVHAENIAVAPDCCDVGAGNKLHFSLIFSGLPKSCNVFDLIEKNENWRPFKAIGIRRNKTDVYFVEV